MDKLEYRLRTLTINDHDRMVKLWDNAGLATKPKGRDSEASIEAQMRACPEFFVGALEGSKLIGTVIASSDGRKGWINRLAVHPDYRRRGVAKALVAEAERILRESGGVMFSALIMNRNRASKRMFKGL